MSENSPVIVDSVFPPVDQIRTVQSFEMLMYSHAPQISAQLPRVCPRSGEESKPHLTEGTDCLDCSRVGRTNPLRNVVPRLARQLQASGVIRRRGNADYGSHFLKPSHKICVIPGQIVLSASAGGQDPLN